MSKIVHIVKAILLPTTNSMWVTLKIFVEGSLMTPFNMSNSLWVTLHTLWKAVSLYFFLWPTASEKYCTFLKDSPITSFPMTNSKWVTLKIFVESSLTTPFSMTNSLWVTWHILWMAVSSYFLLWPTVCEQYCTFYAREAHHTFSMTNSLWVTLHIL